MHVRISNFTLALEGFFISLIKPDDSFTLPTKQPITYDALLSITEFTASTWNFSKNFFLQKCYGEIWYYAVTYLQKLVDLCNGFLAQHNTTAYCIMHNFRWWNFDPRVDTFLFYRHRGKINKPSSQSKSKGSALKQIVEWKFETIIFLDKERPQILRVTCGSSKNHLHFTRDTHSLITPPHLTNDKESTQTMEWLNF